MLLLCYLNQARIMVRFDHRLCHRVLHLSQLFSRAWDPIDSEQSAATGIIRLGTGLFVLHHRFDVMAEYMQKVGEPQEELSVEERNLLSVVGNGADLHPGQTIRWSRQCFKWSPL